MTVLLKLGMSNPARGLGRIGTGLNAKGLAVGAGPVLDGVHAGGVP